MAVIETFLSSFIPQNKVDGQESDLATCIIIFIIYVGILLLLGKYLWNNVLVNMIPSLNRIDDIWQIFGFIVFIIILKRI